MRKLVSVLAVLFIAYIATAEDRWPGAGGSFGSGGSGSSSGGTIITFAQEDLQTSFSDATCPSWIFNTSSSTTCTLSSAQVPVTGTATRVRWEVYLQTATTVGTAGCTITLVAGDATTDDITTASKPMMGETGQVVAGRTTLSTANQSYGETILIPGGLVAGNFMQVRFNNEAGGSAGNDGTCVGANTASGVRIKLYALQ